jgi:hypothetical protein
LDKEVSMPRKRAPDVTVSGEGPGTSVYLFIVHTPAARKWVDENVQLEGYQWLGANSFGVEHRFARDLSAGMQEAGLMVV